ncbi:pyridoxal phosphate-dependent aminotransferase [Pontivivens insulae]|uniref:Aminotransferase n=1 Tax=Pontivivens insulae TaxID=1639689 RepID=A0A2R8AB54_9RHOB|nr:aminotransferase class I/II-fold pyridoxal phosphate-dependent enzyme [Pontivivens insulae]RED11370.1 aspartate/methionine/tyrosine aminotransferase [Pontivivens insulae]SPF29457.1 Putative N-acetyl-LL-diaminopimelate aminotransferase [Pontivivens insulae]
MRISSRSEVDSFIVMDVMEAARQVEDAGQSVIHMEVGQPGTAAPAAAREAVANAMEQGPLGYTVALGLPALRARIARLYGEWYDVDLDPGRVVVTAGSSAGFLLSFLSLFDAGQRVGIADPGYPSYRNILRALNLEPVRIEGTLEGRFQPQPADLTHDLDGVLVASPANPTGSMLGREALSNLLEAARANDVAFISDEIYHGLDYAGQRGVTALELTDEAIVINSFSKYFSMTGWRVGWMVVPESHVRTIERLAQNLFICPSHASQIAALGAMDATDELEANRAVYARNRTILLDALTQAGFADIAPPDGAFYIYANIAATGLTSRTFTDRLLREAGVAATPGLDFDKERGHHTVRFSYAGSTEAIQEGAERIARFMQQL